MLTYRSACTERRNEAKTRKISCFRHCLSDRLRVQSNFLNAIQTCTDTGGNLGAHPTMQTQFRPHLRCVQFTYRKRVLPDTPPRKALRDAYLRRAAFVDVSPCVSTELLLWPCGADRSFIAAGANRCRNYRVLDRVATLTETASLT